MGTHLHVQWPETNEFLARDSIHISHSTGWLHNIWPLLQQVFISGTEFERGQMDYQIDKCNRTLKAIKDEECPFERILNQIRCTVITLNKVVHLAQDNFLLTLKYKLRLSLRSFYCSRTFNLKSTMFRDQMDHPVVGSNNFSNFPSPDSESLLFLLSETRAECGLCPTPCTDSSLLFQ